MTEFTFRPLQTTYCMVDKFEGVKFLRFSWVRQSAQKRTHQNSVPHMHTKTAMCYLNPCVTQCEFSSPQKLSNEAISIITQNFTPSKFTNCTVVSSHPPPACLSA